MRYVISDNLSFGDWLKSIPNEIPPIRKPIDDPSEYFTLDERLRQRDKRIERARKRRLRRATANQISLDDMANLLKERGL